MILDAHHHFWNYNDDEFGWINDGMRVIKRSVLPDDLAQAMEGTEVQGVVSVQARQSIEETEWLLQLADAHDFIKGVVGWVDLCSPMVDVQLRRYMAHPKFVGVRHVLQDEPDDYFMLRKDFMHGISLLGKYDLTYDILIYPKHLPTAWELVNKFPGQKFVLDHIAKPYIKDNKITEWQSNIERLAQRQNVWCKVSGMVTEADWNQWTPEQFHPYLDVIYNAFGEHRLMIGSDWPVCLLGGAYTDVLNIPLQYFANLSESAQRKIKAENCRDFYGLKQLTR